MKVVYAGYERINDKDFKNPLQKVERIARICYKSEDNITENSYKKMTEVLMNRQHLAMFEHAYLAFEVDADTYDSVVSTANIITTVTNQNQAEIANMNRVHFTRTLINTWKNRFIVSANIRAFYEFFKKAVEYNEYNRYISNLYHAVNEKIENLFDIPELKSLSNSYTHVSIKEITDFSKLTPSERLIHETFTVIFTCDREIANELVRMRDASFAQESTRYCSYQLGKFGNEITVIYPCMFHENPTLLSTWLEACQKAEEYYFSLLEYGEKAQAARSVLPTSVKADIAITTNLYEWRHIFRLRACDSTGPAHPQMKEIMVPLCKEMKEVIPEIFKDLEPKETYSLRFWRQR